MRLSDLLTQNRSRIIKQWQKAVLATYPEDARRFLGREKDRFSNPVGHVISQEIETLFDAVASGADGSIVRPCLDNIIRVRAVQNFTPSEAVSFVADLKKVIRQEASNGALEGADPKEVLDLEDRIDSTLLMAFDVYTQCRQRVYEIRVNEVRNQVGRLLQRAGVVCEIPGIGPNGTENSEEVL